MSLGSPKRVKQFSSPMNKFSQEHIEDENDNDLDLTLSLGLRKKRARQFSSSMDKFFQGYIEDENENGVNLTLSLGLGSSKRTRQSLPPINKFFQEHIEDENDLTFTLSSGLCSPKRSKESFPLPQTNTISFMESVPFSDENTSSLFVPSTDYNTSHLLVSSSDDNINNTNVDANASTRRRRRVQSKQLAQGKSETVPVPFPWATDRRATVHNHKYLLQNNILIITGEVQCNKCDHKFELSLDLEEKVSELQTFIQKEREAMHNRAPDSWMKPVLPKCPQCRSQNTKPIFTKKKAINWLFLYLSQMIGCCTLQQLKYFCKHTNNHRTGAKDRLIYLTYIALYKQLVSHHGNPKRARRSFPSPTPTSPQTNIISFIEIPQVPYNDFLSVPSTSHNTSPLLVSPSYYNTNPLSVSSSIDHNTSPLLVPSSDYNTNPLLVSFIDHNTSPLLVPSFDHNTNSLLVSSIDHNTSSLMVSSSDHNINPGDVANVDANASTRFPRRASSKRPTKRKRETIPPPFPWATDRRAIVHNQKYLQENNILTITGELQCKRCEHKLEVSLDLEEKVVELRKFIQKVRDSMHDRAPDSWVKPVLPKCPQCKRDSAKPIFTKKKSINWLFLLLNQMLGCCTLEQLKYFCKHTDNHRTGAKDRLIFLTYMSLCKQLVSE
ncbi:hypothetical protein CR513_29034, partial [Mucuna pruriens]